MWECWSFSDHPPFLFQAKININHHSFLETVAFKRASPRIQPLNRSQTHMTSWGGRNVWAKPDLIPKSHMYLLKTWSTGQKRTLTFFLMTRLRTSMSRPFKTILASASTTGKRTRVFRERGRSVHTQKNHGHLERKPSWLTCLLWLWGCIRWASCGHPSLGPPSTDSVYTELDAPRVARPPTERSRKSAGAGVGEDRRRNDRRLQKSLETEEMVVQMLRHFQLPTG